ncbi:MAG TPA: PIG-L family deacetylase [Gemmatimonadales bacterium]|nr:PIG-L family deacetylase [Gemmatimonadales bacterium]
MRRSSPAARSIVLAACLLGASPVGAPLLEPARGGLAAQLAPPSTGGRAALWQQLAMLGHHKRVLMIGAHPDDEDTELLTVLVRGMGAEAAYLSLTRGEGGQNLIGAELGDALGLLRTEELLAARRLDGARQFFTNLYDFGFSKTLDDTWRHWPRDSVLKEVVRAVRRFRPQVIVSVFSGSERDGHGQHQAAGRAAIEAFRAAGDEARFPELAREEGLAPWTPLKLYRSTRFDSAATTLELDGGVLDPWEGQSYHQIAMRARSLHRSQDMGQLQRPGPSTVRLALLEDRTGADAGGVFAGIDTTFGSGLGPAAASYAALADSARRPGLDPADRVALLRRMRRILLEAGGSGSSSAVGHRLPVELADQLARVERAIVMERRVVVDALADDPRVIPGQAVRLRLQAWNAGVSPVTVRPGIADAGRWRARVDSAPGTSAVAPGGLATWVVSVRVPTDAAPGEADSIMATFELDDGIVVRRTVVHRALDQAIGEVRRPVFVLPRLDVKLEPGMELWSTTAVGARRFTVTMTHGARDTTEGRVRLELPAGWPAVPPRPFRFTREDERETFAFEVRPPARLPPDTLEIRAVAEDASGARYELGVFTVEYPHIRPRAYVRSARARVNAAPLALPRAARIGYVRGAADRVPEALRRVGLPVELLDGAALERGDLSRYDAIVVGPRAYEVTPALAESNGRLLAYAREGGLVIVQYQQYGYFDAGYPPYPMQLASRAPGQPNSAAGVSPVASRGTVPVSLRGGHDRVTDEAAPVRVLDPAHPVFRRPNRLDARDWDGWVQERGLYFARVWDPAYRPLIETHDPGEGPLEGGLLLASVGKGHYVYTGLSFFRQLPAGVPGAFRLFANLLALGDAGR